MLSESSGDLRECKPTEAESRRRTDPLGSWVAAGALAVAAAQGQPVRQVPEPACAGQAPGAACWMELEDRPEVPCVEGKAQAGRGRDVDWRLHRWSSGRFRNTEVGLEISFVSS